MDRIKNLFKPTTAYEPIADDNVHAYEEDDTPVGSAYGDTEVSFSWVEYGVFLLQGVAMLWAWNMFMAAAPYFHTRFQSSNWILNHFQPAEVSTSTLTSLASVLILSKMQENASYPKRITVALIISSVTFAVLVVSTLFDTSASVYFGFLLVAIFFASLGSGLIQNGLYAFASGFGNPKYMQGIMTGQGIAGVLPPLVQIISVAATKPKSSSGVESSAQPPASAFFYFLAAVVVSVVALLAFLYLLRRMAKSGHSLLNNNKDASERAGLVHDTSGGDVPAVTGGIKPAVPLLTLFRKLLFLSLAVFLCFTVTMVFPVFTTTILSTSGIDPAIFIPLAFFIWNLGDLTGRLVTAIPSVSLTYYPFALFSLAMARLLFIPLYFLCNIKGRGAVVNSDFFYLGVVQFLFGLSNGYLGSQCMMGAGDWVLPEEREAAGGFMGLMLVGGLTVGSLLSFLLGDI